MKRKLSLQWRLTLVTALLVTCACLILNYFISTSAIFRMDEIENSVITVLPAEIFSEGEDNATGFQIDISGDITNIVQTSQTEFRIESLLVTVAIALVSSAITYFIVGHYLRPLKQLGTHVSEIQTRNISQPVAVRSNSAEILQLEDAFNGMLQRMDEAFSAQRQFSANAAHELRTPLAIMQTKIEVFEKQVNKSSADCEEAMKMLRLQTDRLSHVISVLLELTELQTTKKNDNISLSELIEEVLCDLAPLGEENHVTLSQKPGEVKIFGSDTLIYRAVYNLVENAIKYNHSGGEVAVEIKKENAFAKIIVTDTGFGISEADCEKIFEPFFRVDKSRNRAVGGAGLGLALVKEIAHQHGGDVSVRYSSSAGTQIELCLFTQR